MKSAPVASPPNFHIPRPAQLLVDPWAFGQSGKEEKKKQPKKTPQILD